MRDVPATSWTAETDTFGTRIWAMRRELGWNRQRLAAECGVSPASVRSWERGSLPRNMPQVVQAISDATGVDRDWLMWGETNRRLSPDSSLNGENRCSDLWPYAA